MVSLLAAWFVLHMQWLHANHAARRLTIQAAVTRRSRVISENRKEMRSEQETITFRGIGEYSPRSFPRRRDLCRAASPWRYRLPFRPRPPASRMATAASPAASD